MTATELVNVNVEAKLSFQSNCALKSPVLALFGGQLLIGRFGDWLVIFDCGLAPIRHIAIINGLPSCFNPLAFRIGTRDLRTATKFVQVDVEFDLACQCLQLLGKAHLLCAILRTQVIHRSGRPDFLVPDIGLDYLYFRHIAIMNVRSSRFNPRTAAQFFEINSDQPLKRPVPALLSGQLSLDILDGGFVFIGHSTILNAAAISLQSFIALFDAVHEARPHRYPDGSFLSTSRTILRSSAA